MAKRAEGGVRTNHIECMINSRQMLCEFRAVYPARLFILGRYHAPVQSPPIPINTKRSRHGITCPACATRRTKPGPSRSMKSRQGESVVGLVKLL